MSWATNWRVAKAKRSNMPQSTRSGICESAGTPSTLFCTQSSSLSNAPGSLAANDVNSAGLIAQIPAVRAAPSRAPRCNAPYPPIDQPMNPTREVSMPIEASIGSSSSSTIAPESTPVVRRCQ